MMTQYPIEDITGKHTLYFSTQPPKEPEHRDYWVNSDNPKEIRIFSQPIRTWTRITPTPGLEKFINEITPGPAIVSNCIVAIYKANWMYIQMEAPTMPCANEYWVPSAYTGNMYQWEEPSKTWMLIPIDQEAYNFIEEAIARNNQYEQNLKYSENLPVPDVNNEAAIEKLAAFTNTLKLTR
jgi:hypothetical protein